jgi:photosystem II stability/assembly factor-like uncharacterized protein
MLMIRLFLSILSIITILYGLPGCTRGEPTVFAVAVHPTNPSIIYLSTRDTIYKSRDGGQTWTAMREGLEQAQVISLAIDPVLSSTIYAGTFATAVYKSSDGGQRWRSANIGLKGHVSVVNAIVIHPKDHNILYIGTTIGPYRSTDGGESWVEIVQGMESVYVASLVIDPQNPSVLYAGTTGGIYKSMDGGTQWKEVNKGLFEEGANTAMALGVNTIAIDPVEPPNVFIGTTQGLYASANGGDQWVPKNKGLDTKFVGRLLIDPNNRNVLFAGTQKGVYKSTDHGETWKATNNGLTNLVVRSMVLDPSNTSTVYVGTQGGLFKSTDEGNTWTQMRIRRTQGA